MFWLIIPATIVLIVGIAIKMWGVQDLVAAVSSPTSVESEDEKLVRIREYRPENWCLMGENTTGRFCIRLEKPDQCTPKHRFASREACEMTESSSLPLGISNTGGRFHSPLMEPARSLATTY